MEDTSAAVASLAFDDTHGTPLGVTVSVSLGSEGKLGSGHGDGYSDGGVGVEGGSIGSTPSADVDVMTAMAVMHTDQEVVPEEQGAPSRIYTNPPDMGHHGVSGGPMGVEELDEPLDAVVNHCLDTVLSDEARKHENWQERVHAMDTLTRLILGGACSIPYFVQEMNSSHHVLETQINDRRSAVARQACVLVGTLVQYCGLAAKNIALALQPSLLKLHGVSIAVMSQSGQECLDCIYEYCHDGRLLSHLCSVICTDRNVKLRHGAVLQLLRVMECWEEGLVEQYRVDMEQTMMAAVVEASEGVRRVGRQMFEVHCLRFGGGSNSWAGRLVDGIEKGVWSKVDGGTKKTLVELYEGVGGRRIFCVLLPDMRRVVS